MPAEMSTQFRVGQKVIVHFEDGDGKLRIIKGKFTEYIDIGMDGAKHGVVKFSKYGSVMAPIEAIKAG